MDPPLRPVLGLHGWRAPTCRCGARWLHYLIRERHMDTSEDDFLPLSALNDFLFCARRCALHRIEGVWTENVHTVEGSQAHRRVHTAGKYQSEESPFREV